MSRVAAVMLATVALLVGCGVPAGSEDDQIGSEFSRRMSDGRTVICLWVDRGVSCDWEGAS